MRIGVVGIEVGIAFQEVEPGDKEGDKDDGAINGFESVGFLIFFFEGSVEAFDELLEDAVLFGFGVEVFQADDFFVMQVEAILFCELMSELIDGVSVGDEEQMDEVIFQEAGMDFLDVLEESGPCGLGVAVQADVLAGDELLFGDIGEDDIAPCSGDTDVGFVHDEVMVDVDGGFLGEGAESEGGGFDVVEDGLVGEGDGIEVEESLFGFSCGEAELDVEVEDQADDGEGVVDSGEVDGGHLWAVGFTAEQFEGRFPKDVTDLEEVGF